MKKIEVFEIMQTLATMGELKGRGENFEFEDAIFDNRKKLVDDYEKILENRKAINFEDSESATKWNKYIDEKIETPEMVMIARDHLPKELNVAQYSIIREWMM